MRKWNQGEYRRDNVIYQCIVEIADVYISDTTEDDLEQCCYKSYYYKSIIAMHL